MILYQRCCLSALSLFLPLSLSLSGPLNPPPLLFFFCYSHSNSSSLCFAPFPVLPTSSLLALRASNSPFTHPSSTSLLEVVDLVYAWSSGKAGFKEKACLKQQIFLFFYWSLHWGPVYAFLPSCRNQAPPPHPLDWGSPGNSGFFFSSFLALKALVAH